MRCRPHRVLVVEEWTSLGANVSCIDCDQTFHLYTPELEKDYLGFEHTSQDGPGEDKWILVHNQEIR